MKVYYCPVCLSETSNCTCSCCGYDQSVHYEYFASLIDTLPEMSFPVSALQRRLFEQKTREEAPESLYQRAQAETQAEKRAELLKRAAFFGFLPAQCELAEYYLRTGNYAEAAVLYKKAALQGDADACLQLSRCYSSGKGLDISEPLALAWLRRSASLGSPLAKQELADRYLYGNGVRKDECKAESLYIDAAYFGYSYGLLHLAQRYLAGKLLPKNTEKAIFLLQIATKYGNRDAEVLLSSISKNEEA